MFVEDDFSNNVNTTGVLTADAVPVTGNFELPEDEDWFALHVTEGESYFVEFTSTDIPVSLASLDLLSGDGILLELGSNIQSFEAETTGTVFIRADTGSSGAVGEYQLTVFTENDVTLTEDDDVYVAPPLTNEVHGLGGDDTIFGGDGNDRIFGGDGNDMLLSLIHI